MKRSKIVVVIMIMLRRRDTRIMNLQYKFTVPHKIS